MKSHVAHLLPLICGLSLFMGCSAEEHEDHLEHHTPDHKPADYSDAVAETQRRSMELRSMGSLNSAERTTKVNELFDIIRWLPELAGESDMREEPWNQVNAISQSLAAALEPMRQARTDNTDIPLPSPEVWDEAVRQLHKLVPFSRPAVSSVEASHGS
jgi:hypothetical protein